MSNYSNLEMNTPAFQSASVPDKLIAYGAYEPVITKGINELIDKAHAEFEGDSRQVIHKLTNHLCYYMAKEFAPKLHRAAKGYCIAVDENKGCVDSVKAFMSMDATDEMKTLPLPTKALRFISGGLGLVLKRYPQEVDRPAERTPAEAWAVAQGKAEDPVEPMD